MLLIVKYKSGEVRRVNLTQEFFNSYDLSISKRALDFAHMNGSDVYHVSVQRGNEIVFENIYRSNAPEEKSSEFIVDESNIKKMFRNKHKNDKFTTKVIL
jgi:hypothetical protein